MGSASAMLLAAAAGFQQARGTSLFTLKSLSGVVAAADGEPCDSPLRAFDFLADVERSLECLPRGNSAGCLPLSWNNQVRIKLGQSSSSWAGNQSTKTADLVAPCAEQFIFPPQVGQFQQHRRICRVHLFPA